MPTVSLSINNFISNQQAQIEQDLINYFQGVDFPTNLKQAVHYACLNGGKRVRPALVFAAAQTVLAQPLTAFSEQLQSDLRRCALAVELLHCYSLVHDDMPCMDDDELRRGKPTCHIAFGEGVALLTGDILQSLAFEALTGDISGFQPPNNTAKLLAIFAPRTRRMVTGQMRDINAENSFVDSDNESIDTEINDTSGNPSKNSSSQKEANTQNIFGQQHLEQIHNDKTGALIEASVLMGAVCCDASAKQLTQLQQFSQKLGLAFQVQDDILDITASTEALGKPAGSDEKLAKATYPKLMGLDNANAYAKQLFNQATQALVEDFVADNLLKAYADWLWQRKK